MTSCTDDIKKKNFFLLFLQLIENREKSQFT